MRCSPAAVATWLLMLLVPASWPRAACDLALSIDPPELSSGKRVARVRVVTGGAKPQLVASAGELKNLRRDGSSAFVADYVPPSQGNQRFAVVAAALDHGACGFGTVHFGAGPGRPVETMAVLVSPPAARTDHEEEVFAYAFALDGKGLPWLGGAPSFIATAGELSRPERVGPGVWRCKWRVRPSGRAWLRGTDRTASVTAELAGGAPVSATLRYLGPVAELQVEFERQPAVAGNPVGVIVRARDAQGSAIDADVSIDSDIGEVGETSRQAPGLYRTQLTVPAVLKGDRSIFVLARASSVSTNATLNLVPGPPASISVDAPDSLRADGSTSCQMSVMVADAFGNPVDEPPTGEADYGELGRPARVGPGQWVLDYRPRRLSGDVEDVVRIRAGTSSGMHEVRLVAPMATLSLAPKAGAVLGSGGTRAAVSAEISAWARLGSAQIGLVLEGSYWSLGTSGPVQGLAGVDFSGDRSYLPLTLSVAWRQPIGSRVLVWLSLGGGAARVSSTVKLIQLSQTVDEARWAPAVSGALSLGLHAWRGSPFVELRAMSIGDPHLETLSGSLAPIFFLQAGYRFDAG
jgi:hypothetical protein